MKTNLVYRRTQVNSHADEMPCSIQRQAESRDHAAACEKYLNGVGGRPMWLEGSTNLHSSDLTMGWKDPPTSIALILRWERRVDTSAGEMTEP